MVILILTLVGPFYTLTSLNFSARLVYWTLIASLNYLAGFCFSLYFGHLLYSAGLSELASRLVASFLSGIPITLIVWNVNVYFYEFNMSESIGFFSLLFYCCFIAMAIGVLFYMFSLETGNNESLSNQPAVKNSSPVFMRRLPAHIGKKVLSLEAQDHYVNVTTDIGSALVLIRLADAIEELDGLEGLRIHRSHWVATEAIARTLRKDGKLQVELTNGTALPVSRTYAQNLKQRFAV